PAPSAAAASADARGATSRSRRLVGAAALAMLVAAGAAVFVLLGGVGSGRDGPTPPASEPPESAENPLARTESRAVAVLPFVSVSRAPEDESFADGLSAELIDALSRIPGVVMSGRASSFYFKDRNEPLDAIGRALNVEHVLTGSVQRSGDRVRIAAELLDARTGYRLWGDSYERPLDDILAIQDEITEHV